MRKILPFAILLSASMIVCLTPARAQSNDPNAATAAARAQQAEINRRNEEAAAKLRAEQVAINRRNEDAARARNAATTRPPTGQAQQGGTTNKPAANQGTSNNRAAAQPSTRAGNNKPATAQGNTRNTQPSAARQLEYGARGGRERDHTFDGTRKPANPVEADPAKKPDTSGARTTDFKPKPVPSSGSDLARMRISPPPSPNGVARSTSPITTGTAPARAGTGGQVAKPPAPAPAARPAPAPVAAKPAVTPVPSSTAAKTAPATTTTSKPADDKKKP